MRKNKYYFDVLSKKDIDLHIHTYFSDGASSPVDAINFLYKNGIKEVAITDHDTVNGVLEAEKQANQLGMIFHRGIEISSDIDGVHILGYDIDINNRGIKEICNEMAHTRRISNEEIFDIVYRDFKIDRQEIINSKPTDYIGRPDIARVLVSKGYGKSVNEVFETYFSKPEIDNIERISVPIEKAIKVILNAGGYPVLAHPIITKGLGERGSIAFYDNLEKFIKKLKSMGLQGIEAVYRKNSLKETEVLIEMAKANELFITRGTDYHN